MDAAFQYDHIASQNYDRAQTPTPSSTKPPDAQLTDDGDINTTVAGVDTGAAATAGGQSRQNLQTEFQETFRAFSNSPWGARLGGLWGNVRKQGESYYKTGESYYEGARKEVENRGADALKELEGLRSKVANVDLGVVGGRSRSDTVKQADMTKAETSTTATNTGEEVAADTATESADQALQDNENFIARFKMEAAKRLKEVQKAEDAADEALARFGTNVRNFLRDAVSVTAPEPSRAQSTEVLFESKDAITGKRVIHTSRFDAQLHVIHTTATSFSQDPDTDGEWDEFKQTFDIEKKTTDIAKDLEKYSELRNAMEKLVPENVEYKDFWTRYYFLRHVVEMQEEKRREMLKASANQDEEVAWDEDSDSESELGRRKDAAKLSAHKSNESTSTLQPKAGETSHQPPSESRRSHDEKSVADSDASYDLVSGTTTGAPGSPRDAKPKADDSDEEDWE